MPSMEREPVAVAFEQGRDDPPGVLGVGKAVGGGAKVWRLHDGWWAVGGRRSGLGRI